MKITSQNICRRCLFVSIFLLGLFKNECQAQYRADGYDDYGNFTTDPVELDAEVAELFGRYFQSSLQIGTALLTGDLGKAYSAGFFAGVKFVFYFDRIWAAELGGGFARMAGLYNTLNTGTSGVDLSLSQTLVPVHLGLRYGFDLDRLPKGFTTLNPYVSANSVLYFRREAVVGTPDLSGLDVALQGEYAPGNIKASTAFGLNVGGGIEFDVYKRKVMLGLDLRYNIVFWPDSAQFFGAGDGNTHLARGGHLITITGSATYNY